jgi:alpha-L-fucosidase
MTQNHSRRQFMKVASLAAVGLATETGNLGTARSVYPGLPDKYQPNWDSLRQYRVPDWYRDARFGIFLHWGVYSVPAYDNEWYPRNMYVRSEKAFDYHRRQYGPQSIFGYKDFIPMFRAERWEPDRWVELFKRAGAKYIVPVGEHHDGFPMYDCVVSQWTSVRMGPHRDIVGELSRAVRNQRLKLGVSSHRAFNWSYYTFGEDFDTNNPRFSGLYGMPHTPTPLIDGKPGELRQTAPRDYIQDWFSRTVNIVDAYQPDLMWFDFCFEGPEWKPYRKHFAAYYYNKSEDWQKGVVVNYKHHAYPEDVAVLDIERGLLDEIRPNIWQTDTSVGWKSWGYIQDEEYKSAADIIPELIDIVSKNGCLLLNVGPRADGTIPEQAEKTLRDIGRWLDVNGEAVYGAAPWKVYGEGPTKFKSGYFGEKSGQSFTAADVRFTTKGEALYAICLAWPAGQLRLRSLAKRSRLAAGKISAVKLLGADDNLEWTQEDDALVVKTPRERRGEYAYTFKIVLGA